ncbi:hypothetical protein NW759_015229 [Fusarium solani]|nr:hypothetical protein NW759_015229 [Fusarium solani]
MSDVRSTGALKTSRLTEPCLPEECHVCDKLLSLLQTPVGRPSHPEYRIYWEEVLTSACPYHPKLLAAILGVDLKPNTAKDISVLQFKGYDHIQIVATVKSSDGEKQFGSGELQLLSRGQDSRRIQGPGKLVNPQWIQTGLVRRWKEKCLALHGDTCGSASEFGHGIQPTWVIDVQRQCLVRPLPSDKYVALSYVWGEVPTFMTKLNNVAQLQKPSSLAAGNTDIPIPRTIRDAMSCVEELGERYLWTDSLCIVQDDFSLKSTEINNMAAIYSNATLTIIAADGVDADSGLPGLESLTAPRFAEQKIHTLRLGIEVVESIGPSPGLFAEPTKWSTRGWTYQEYVFSQRRLLFEGGWVRWICACDTWCEVGEARDADGAGNLDVRRAISRPVPNLELLNSMINQYNRRDLTYPEDALNGLTGVLNAFTPRFGGGFISGLPAAIFHIAVLWEPFDTLTRRQAATSSHTDVCLPSWSWIGWKGGLAPFAWSPALDFVRSSKIREGARFFDRVKPLVEWSWRKDPKAESNRIHCTWFEYQQKFAGKDSDSSPCPPGWTRHDAKPRSSEEEFIYQGPNPGYPPDYFYQHDSEPESEFWYPIPLPDASPLPGTQIAAPLISCQTKRAFAYRGEVITPTYRRGGTVISLRDVTSTWLGALRLHGRPTWMDGGTDDISNQPIELVEIALGSVPEDARKWLPYHQVLDEWDHEERPRNGDVYKYYFVLWVERKGDVAYRRGLGRVEQQLWEVQARESIELILG